MVYLYTINGGYVVGVSLDADAYAKVDTSVYGVVADPPLQDGKDLSAPKVYDGQVLRNATPDELANQKGKQDTDTDAIARKQAIVLLQSNPLVGKVLRAIVAELAQITKSDVEVLMNDIVQTIASGGV